MAEVLSVPVVATDVVVVVVVVLVVAVAVAEVVVVVVTSSLEGQPLSNKTRQQ